MSVVINGIEYVPKLKLKLQHVSGESFGSTLRSMRKAAKYSLDKAAVEIGCSKSYLWDLEHDSGEPSLRMAAKIAEAYGVPILALARCLDTPSNADHEGQLARPAR
jgi:transcriptional regulator with XRE-family HTH domain